MSEYIVLVDENDQEIGYGEKLEVHVKHQLHRAFSIFIYDVRTKRMLIQKRAEGKYHSGGKWSNACCSHPRKDEIMEEALCRRLEEELGFLMPERMCIHHYPELPEKFGRKDIIEVGHFTYFAQFDGLAEHEIDHVYVYYPDEEQILNICCNPEEISDVLWVTMEELMNWVKEDPDNFSAWFANAFNLTIKIFE